MKILDLLRKLGIFRSGSISGSYTSAKNMQTEFLIDDIANAKKDLTTKKDVKNVIAEVVASNQADPKKVGLGRKVFFWIMIAIGILFIFGYFNSGFSFSLLFFLILWGGLLFLLKKFAFQGFYSFWLVIVATLVVFFVSLMIFPSNKDDSEKSSTLGKSLEQYDNKIFTLTSADGKLNGFAAIKVKQNVVKKKPFLEVMYYLKIKDNIPVNTSMGCGETPSFKAYHYVGSLSTPLSENKIKPVGAISEVYCNKDAWPEDLFDFNVKTYKCPKVVTTGTVTDTFVPNFKSDFFSFEEFMAANTYEVFDGANAYAWVENKDNKDCIIKGDIALSQGKKVKSYVFTITEKQ